MWNNFFSKEKLVLEKLLSNYRQLLCVFVSQLREKPSFFPVQKACFKLTHCIVPISCQPISLAVKIFCGLFCSFKSLVLEVFTCPGLCLHFHGLAVSGDVQFGGNSQVFSAWLCSPPAARLLSAACLPACLPPLPLWESLLLQSPLRQYPLLLPPLLEPCVLEPFLPCCYWCCFDSASLSTHNWISTATWDPISTWYPSICFRCGSFSFTSASTPRGHHCFEYCIGIYLVFFPKLHLTFTFHPIQIC